MTNDHASTDDMDTDKIQPCTAEEPPLRCRRADEYFDVHLQGQEQWYDRRATRHRTWHHVLGLVIVVVATTTSVIQMFAPVQHHSDDNRLHRVE